MPRSDPRVAEAVRGSLDALADMGLLGQVDLARGANQAGELRLGVHDEPRVDRDAVAADAGSGRQDIDARVQVGELDETSQSLICDASQINDNSFAKAMLTSR